MAEELSFPLSFPYKNTHKLTAISSQKIVLAFAQPQCNLTSCRSIPDHTKAKQVDPQSRSRVRADEAVNFPPLLSQTIACKLQSRQTFNNERHIGPLDASKRAADAF